ncbi:MAG: sulfotransferase family 2 domain-containing protein [Phycisphaerae bacterium]
MVISHKYRFIFIKTRKTAGTSIESYLSTLCDETDVFAPIKDADPGEHRARNFAGFFNPLPEILASLRRFSRAMRHLRHRNRYYNHMDAYVVRARTPRRIWRSYLKFCVERNPWDKTLSHYHFIATVRKDRFGVMSLDEYFQRGFNCVNYPKYTEPGEPSRLIVDRVLRYESLNEELAEVFADLGVPFEGRLGVRAKGDLRKDRRPYQEVLTEEQAATIARLHRPEIELMGYEF